MAKTQATEKKQQLPPHLLDLISKLERQEPKFVIHDVTPKGFGPNGY